MTPILFLDVDGVLNRLGTRTRNYDGNVGIDPEILAMFVEWLERTACRVVLSSTWRKNPRLVEDLDRAIGGRIIGLTPVHEERTTSGLWVASRRGNEISAWLESDGHSGPYCVLDDLDSRSIAPHEVRHVRPDDRCGVTATELDSATELLEARR